MYKRWGESLADFITMHGFMCGLGNQIIAHAHCLRAFNRARDRVALSTVTLQILTIATVD